MQTLINKLNARDPLFADAEAVAREAHGEVLDSFLSGDRIRAEAALRRHDEHVRDLVENLRVYQAELHAQADELAASQERTEQALRGFAALFSHMPVAVLQVAMNGEIMDCNARARELFNLYPSAARARFLHRYVAPRDYQEVVRPALHEARATGWSVVKSAALVTEASRPFEGEVHVAAIPSAPGQVPLFACAVLDRTEQRETLRALQSAVETLRRSEAFLADSARLAQIGGWELVESARGLRWSREMCALFETPAGAEPDGLTALRLCSRPDRRRLRRAMGDALTLGLPFDLEIDVRSHRGRPMRVLVFGHAEMSGEVCKRVSGVCQDITSQHGARRQIGDLTARLNMAHEAGGIGVWDWDLPSERLFLDARMADLLDMPGSAGVFAGLREALQERLQPEDAQRLDTALQRALDHDEPLSLDICLHGLVGGLRYVHLTGRARLDESGRPLRLIGCAWDCTAQKEAERLTAAKEAAEFASRAKSAFLSRMSHELRTPLNAILGFSQLMRLEAAAGDLVVKPQRALFIETAARHLLDLITEVLDVSRIESGQLALNMAPVKLNQVVEECLPMVIEQADAQGLRIHNRLAASAALWVQADRLRLKEVVINLLSNAVKYNAPGGLVLIDAQALEGGAVVLHVADTGRGLDAEQRAGLFQPFNRVGAEATRIEGSGMGLFVSKRFVEMMGGAIDVASQPGVGTRFSVQLVSAVPER